jgi:hypothetical protein
MRFPAYPIIASVALLAAPAFAQNVGVTGAQQYGNQQYGNQQYGSSASTNMQSWQHPEGVTADTQQKIRQSLESSGFKNVQVMPEAFIVRAQAPDGSHIVMLMRPDELMGVVQPSGSSSQPYGSTQGNNWGSGQGNMNH